MRKIKLILIFLLLNKVSFSQDSIHKNSIFVNVGRFNQTYFYWVYDIGYRNDMLIKNKIGLYSRTRIYFSKTSYIPQFDLTFIPVYSFKKIKKLKLNLGIGFDARIRENHYAKNYGTKSSVEPIIFFNEGFVHSRLLLDFEQWTRFYSDGLSIDLVPMVGYKIRGKFGLYLRPEFRFLKKYNSNSEWYNTYYVGLKYYFKPKNKK